MKSLVPAWVEGFDNERACLGQSASTRLWQEWGHWENGCFYCGVGNFVRNFPGYSGRLRNGASTDLTEATDLRIHLP